MAEAHRLTPWLIRYAYEQGAFPMTMEDGSVSWFQPRMRALFPLSGMHVSRSLGKVIRGIRKSGSQGVGESEDLESARPTDSPTYRLADLPTPRLTLHFNHDFEAVMRNCLRPDGNWISEDFIRVYTQIHFEGWAHCCSVYRDSELVGGVYGVQIGACFCAESMFHRYPNASKVALWAMIEKCREYGYTLFDAQIMNPHLASLGAYEMSHKEYMVLLEKAIAAPRPLPIR